MKKICVVGSINMDLVVSADTYPRPGETILGHSFITNPGGKGANQAVAAARLGAETVMLGCVGDDIYGAKLVENLDAEGVDTRHIRRVEGPSGIANILIADHDNSIVVVPGANYTVDRTYLDSMLDVIKESDMVLTQLEIPLDTVLYLSHICKREGIPLLLNPAPAMPLPGELIDNAVYITPNESEVEIIFGEKVDIKQLIRQYPQKLIVTLGKEGAIYFDGAEIVHIPSISVDVVDTTGAGDTFNGAFAVGMMAARDMAYAIALANTAAGLSVTKMGAQKGMPAWREVMDQL